MESMLTSGSGHDNNAAPCTCGVGQESCFLTTSLSAGIVTLAYKHNDTQLAVHTALQLARSQAGDQSTGDSTDPETGYFQALMMPSWLQDSSILSFPCTDDRVLGQRMR